MEYTSRPPICKERDMEGTLRCQETVTVMAAVLVPSILCLTSSSRHPWSAMRNCRRCRLLPFLALHLRQMSAFLRRVPSPEQGTSQRMRWKPRRVCMCV